MKIIVFIKKNSALLVANFIVLGFIAITLLVQFGVHIKVDEDVDLIPVEIGYSQSTRHINSKFVSVSERYVRLKYENSSQKSFWVPADVVFGKAAVEKIEDMIKDGNSVKINVFYDTKSDEVVGVTNSGKSILSLYFYNSKVFRYGILILLLVDIFVGILIMFAHKKEQKTVGRNTMKIGKTKTWQYAIAGDDGNTTLFGVNIFDYKWKRKGERVKVRDPIYGEEHDFDIYSVTINGQEYEFAAGEFSYCIWGFYVLK